MIKLGTNNIGKIYLGSNSIGKAYYGSDLVFQNGASPAPSTWIRYIRGGTGGSYIDTGITPDQTTRIIIWARNWNPGGANYTWLFGSRVANQDSAFAITLMNNANIGKLRVCFGNTNTDLSEKWALMSHYHKYELSADGFFADDVLVSSVSANTFSNNHNIHIFGLNNAGTHTTTVTPIDVCACKIYKNNVLVRDYKAVDSPSIGLYDSVSDTIFTNAGTGSFTFGRFRRDAYDAIDYVCAIDGSSYFDTTEIGDYSVPIVTKFRSTNPDTVYRMVIGAYSEGNRCEILVGNDSIRNARLYGCLGSGSAGAIYSTNTVGFYDTKDIVVIKTNNAFHGYYNNSEIGSGYTGTSTSTFTTNRYLSVGSRNGYDGSSEYHSQNFRGYIYFALIGGSNYVPAMKDNVAGMYDTYNDVFMSSETIYPFISGPYLNPKTITEAGMTLVRYWDGEDSVDERVWYDRIGNQHWHLVSAVHNSNNYEFTNESASSATSCGELGGALPDLGYHWKVVVDVAVVYNTEWNSPVIDFGSFGNVGSGMCAFGIQLDSTGIWRFNPKFNGNDSGPTYNVDTSNLSETGISQGDWVRRTITFGVRASATSGKDESYAIVEGLGTGVSSPFTPIRFNRWEGDCSYLSRSRIEPSSSYPFAATAKIYSIKIYSE